RVIDVADRRKARARHIELGKPGVLREDVTMVTTSVRVVTTDDAQVIEPESLCEGSIRLNNPLDLSISKAQKSIRSQGEGIDVADNFARVIDVKRKNFGVWFRRIKCSYDLDRASNRTIRPGMTRLKQLMTTVVLGKTERRELSE